MCDTTDAAITTRDVLLNQIPKVEPRNHYTVHSNYIHPTEHQQYVTSLPALPERLESPWQRVENKKRPRDNHENLTHNVKQTKLNDYWLNEPFPSNKNRFEELSEERNNEEGVKTKINTFKATPLCVTGVQNIHPLKKLLVTVTGDDFELKILNGNQVKIQPKSAEKYKIIIKALAEKHTEFHTYQPKEDKSFRTVLRGMHYSIDTSEIKSEVKKNLDTR